MKWLQGALALLIGVGSLVAPGAARANTLAIGHAKGVGVQVGRRMVTFRFSHSLDPNVSALLRLAHRVELGCTQLGPTKIDGTRTRGEVTERIVRPRHLSTLRLPTGPGLRPTFCTVRLASRRLDIVDIPVTEDGAVYLDERHVFSDIRNAVFTAASDAEQAHSTAFESAEQFVQKYASDGDIVALATPVASPGTGAIGVFSDGAHHFEAVGTTALGRRMYYDINGDMLTTNGTPYLSDPDGASG